jgi:hypothetical protein
LLAHTLQQTVLTKSGFLSKNWQKMSFFIFYIEKTRGVKKNFSVTILSVAVVKNAKIEKKIFLCIFDDQFNLN